MTVFVRIATFDAQAVFIHQGHYKGANYGVLPCCCLFNGGIIQNTALNQFQALVEEIEALGGTVKDYEAGRIDFYGDVDGEIVYLCWQRGEASIGHWHSLEEGFSSRRLLPATIIAA